MGDGFSDPDPADEPRFDGDPPGDDPTDSIEYDDDATVAGSDVDCRNCAHKQVCTMFEGLAPQLVDYAQDGQQPADGGPQQQEVTPADVDGDIEPIDPHDLAIICSEFLHVEEVN